MIVGGRAVPADEVKAEARRRTGGGDEGAVTDMVAKLQATRPPLTAAEREQGRIAERAAAAERKQRAWARRAAGEPETVPCRRCSFAKPVDADRCLMCGMC